MYQDNDKLYIGGANQEAVITPDTKWVNPITKELKYFQHINPSQPIAIKDPYVDYQFYSPIGNSIVQTINSTPRWQQYWANREGSRVSNAMHQASPKVFDLLTTVDGIATGPEAIEGIYNLSKNLFTKTIPSYQLYRAINRTTPRTTPTFKGFRSHDLTGSPFTEATYTGSPIFEFAKIQGTSPTESYFFRAPKKIDILKLRNGSFRTKVINGVTLPAGNANGKFVSYGEPWQEFDLLEGSALYEFPIGPKRRPNLKATDWRGNEQNFSVDDVFEFMQQERALDEELKNTGAINRSNYTDMRRKLIQDKYPLVADKRFSSSILNANQTVIPSSEWNFNDFLSQPFWKYSENPISGQVQKELFMRYPEEVLPNVPTVEFKATPRTPKITETNAASITPEQWTAAQDAAIARGDMKEAQRLRDLHAFSTERNLNLVGGSPDYFNS